jgi:hypothetical protein
MEWQTPAVSPKRGAVPCGTQADAPVGRPGICAENHSHPIGSVAKMASIELFTGAPSAANAAVTLN